jgi:hypothetical protein
MQNRKQKAEKPTSASLLQNCLLAAVPYQCCPKCEGQGIVAKPSWVAAGVNNWSSTSAVHQCDVCNGAKIIPMYIVPTETKVVENGG